MPSRHTAFGIANFVIVDMAAWPIERKDISTAGKCNHFVTLKTSSQSTV
jgi:hypothetical protein